MEQKKYYSDFIIGLKFFSVCCLLGILFAVGEDFVNGIPVQKIFITLALTTITCLIVTPLVTWLVIRLTPVHINHKGLKSYNTWGIYKEITWDKIGNIKPINLLGFKFIRVKPKARGMAIWVPIWLKDSKGFLESIEFFGGDKSKFEKYF